MKVIQILALAASTLFSTSNAIAIDRRSNCNPNGSPDCMAGYNIAYYNATFDTVTAEVAGTPISTYGPLKLTGFRVASAPTSAPHANAPPHLTPSSGTNYIRAKESSGAFNTTSITTNGTIFKFKSFYFGCSRYGDYTPIPCTLNITGYNPSSNPPVKVNTVSIQYLLGNPGANGQAPLQLVNSAALANLNIANTYVLATSGPQGTKPRLVLDDVDVAVYKYAL